jgi:hypothetical protein
LGELPTLVDIDPDWIKIRDAILDASKNIKDVNDDQTFALAGGLVKDITKRSAELDKMRLSLTKPFRDAVTKINGVSKDALDSLESEKKRLISETSAYFKKKEIEARKARELAEEQARAKVREEEAKKQKEIARAKAVEEAVLEKARTDRERELIKEAVQDKVEEIEQRPAPFVDPNPTLVDPLPKAESVRVRADLVFSISDEAAVPRLMCSPDDRKIRGWIAANKQKMIEFIENREADNFTQSGIEITLKKTVQSR